VTAFHEFLPIASLPDRTSADAAIWALTYLFDLSDGTGIIEFYRREAHTLK
jgi:hypothetical protein